MRKKLFVLAAAVAAILILHSCKMPTAIEIKGKPNVTVPVHSDAGLNDMVTDEIKKIDFGEGNEIKILKVTDYVDPDTSKNLQAFLMHMKYEFDTGIDAADIEAGLVKIKDLNFDIPPEDLSKEIAIDMSGLDTALDSVSIDPVDIELRSVFDGIRDSIEDIAPPGNPLSQAIVIPGVGGGQIDLGELISKEIALDDFTSLTFGSGKIRATVSIKNFVDQGPVPSVANTVDITLGDFSIGGHEFTGQTINLADVPDTKTVVFDFAGVTIATNNGKLAINIGSCVDNSDPTNTLDEATLEIQLETVPADPLKFRQISGITIDETIPFHETIPLNLGVSGFVHAQIGTGTLDLNLELPAYDSSQPNVSGFAGVDIAPHIEVVQMHSDHGGVGSDGDGNVWPGLNNSDSLATDAPPHVWLYTEGNGNLNEKHLNSQDITITALSEVAVSSAPGGATINLSDADMADETISITPRPTLDIDNFLAIHVDMDALLGPTGEKPNIGIPEVDLGEAVDYVKSITFNRVGPRFEFGQVDIANLAIKIHEPNLEIGSPTTYSLIETNGVVDYIRENPPPIELKDINGDVIFDKLLFDVDIRPAKIIKGNTDTSYDVTTEGKVIEIKNISPSTTTELHFTIKPDPEIACDWKEAELDLGSIAVAGDYPKADQDPLDLSAMGKMLKGFTFPSIETMLYTSGPATLFELNPPLTMEARYGAGEPIDLLPAGFTLTNSPVLSIDPDDTGEFSGDLPTGGVPISGFSDILGAQPTDMRFHYALGDMGMTVTPEILDNLDFEGPIAIEILARVPFNLTAGSDAKIVIAEAATAEGGEGDAESLDLFKRKAEDDLEMIKSMSLKIELSESIISAGSGEFYMSDTVHPIRASLTGSKTLTLAMTEDDLKYINSTYPFNPEMGISFTEGTKLSLAEGLGIATIEVNADISLRVEFDSLKSVAEVE